MKNELSTAEYDQIISFLQSQSIEDETLLAEIGDHFAIVIEMYLNQNYSFNEALEKAKENFTDKDLLQVSSTTKSLKGHPKFLNQTFLMLFALVSIVTLLTGLYLRYYHLPYRRLFLMVGAVMTGYFLLPMLLLYRLTEYANKTKQIISFMALFAIFHAFVAYLLKLRFKLLFVAVAIFFALFWLVYFQLIPYLKKRNSITKIHH